MTTPSSPPDDSSALPDDVWEKFQHDSESAIRKTAPKEPSARARMVTRRLREQGPAEPVGWRTGSAWDEMEAPERPAHSRLWQMTRSLLIVIAVGAIVLFALDPSGAMSLLRDKDGGPPATATSAPRAVEPTTTTR
ncbi:hypothetical protein NGB36_24850 [Streptomyces sp. RB6PN25]|uniref:DUF3040 domain-containing protein n=1 Tax=Streptomyces humicola TaxID=2953240 RepID=A0ABT1Q1C2_9ACTN|nr:hypothetical protein [Streptomyces humicola]MCQ4083733.1 hypothetical protein [Streptomyces humicola]